jgi:hypothetical protein
LKVKVVTSFQNDLENQLTGRLQPTSNLGRPVKLILNPPFLSLSREFPPGCNAARHSDPQGARQVSTFAQCNADGKINVLG